MTPRDLQTLRNMGNEAEKAADEIDRLRAELERLRAQEPVAWAYVNTDGECEEITWDSGPCPEECICLYRAAPPAQPAHHPDEFNCPRCFDDPANIRPARRLTDDEIDDQLSLGMTPYSTLCGPDEIRGFGRKIEDAIAAGPQWQPIETAPKDGTQYLACDGKKMWTRNQPPNCYAGDWECNQNRTLWRGHADGLNPTHWMPLPKSPEAI